MSSKGRERPVIYVVPCIAGNLRISGEASLLTYSFEGWIQGGAKGGTYHKHTGEEAAKVDIGRVEFWRKVVGRGAARAYPVGERREDECEGWFVWVQVSHSVRPCKMCVEQNAGAWSGDVPKRTDKEGQPVCPERTRQDDQQETCGQDE